MTGYRVWHTPPLPGDGADLFWSEVLDRLADLGWYSTLSVSTGKGSEHICCHFELVDHDTCIVSFRRRWAVSDTVRTAKLLTFDSLSDLLASI